MQTETLHFPSTFVIQLPVASFCTFIIVTYELILFIFQLLFVLLAFICTSVVSLP